MAMLTGITNANEFYSNHYLDAILKEDIKGIAQGWQTVPPSQADREPSRSPAKQLAALAQPYFRLRDRFRRQRRDSDRLATQRQWLGALLPVLGYELQPQGQPLEQGLILPLVAQVNRPNGLPWLWILEGLPDPTESADLLSLAIVATAHQADPEEAFTPLTPPQDPPHLSSLRLEDILSDYVFAQEDPPAGSY